MPTLGTPLSPSATRLLMLGAGELGKEVVIEAQRLGVEVIAADRYPHAPAMQVAHRSHVLDMLDPQALRELVLRERPALHRARDRGDRDPGAASSSSARDSA